MKKKDIIRAYYEKNMGENIPDYKVLGWESREAQYARFSVLSENVDLEGKKILDVGCGLGNMLDFLKLNNINADYTGVDILEKMVERARIKNPDGRFLCMDIFVTQNFDTCLFDIVYASGIFNLNLENNMAFLQRALEKFFMLSGCMVAFSLLHVASAEKEQGYYYYNPAEVSDIIKKYNISGYDIIEQYLHNDFTVIIKKDPKAPGT